LAQTLILIDLQPLCHPLSSIRERVKGYNQQGEVAIHQKKQLPKKRPSHALLNAQQLEELRLRLKGQSPNRGLGEQTQSCIMGRPKIW
jgi:hypothetical protein